jgi:hypothetical protein
VSELINNGQVEEASTNLTELSRVLTDDAFTDLVRNVATNSSDIDYFFNPALKPQSANNLNRSIFGNPLQVRMVLLHKPGYDNAVKRLVYRPWGSHTLFDNGYQGPDFGYNTARDIGRLLKNSQPGP